MATTAKQLFEEYREIDRRCGELNVSAHRIIYGDGDIEEWTRIYNEARGLRQRQEEIKALLTDDDD